MNINPKTEIKVEELDLEYSALDQEVLISPDSGTDFASSYDIKIEELDDAGSVRSELREIKKEPLLDEGQANNDVIKSEMSGKKFSFQHTKIFPDSGTDFTSPYDIKIKELDDAGSVRSELREIKMVPLSDEEQANNDVIKSEIIGKKFSFYHTKIYMTLKNVCSLSKKIAEKGSEVHFESDEEKFFGNLLMSKFPLVKLNKLTDKEIKSLIGVADQGEQDSILESSESRPLMSVNFDQAINEDCQDYLCRFCNFTFKGKYRLTNHLKTHEKKKFKCTHCTYKCNRKDHLKNHLLTHSNLKLFKCSVCMYECNQKSNLKRHQLIHSNLKFFKCSECSYECKQIGNLKRHLLTHSDHKTYLPTQNNLYKCSECSYESNHKYNLKYHLLSHSNSKLFKCSECNYECNHKGRLKIHLLTHTNLKLFKCPECSYECNHKGHLKLHMLTHTKFRLLKCPECSYECNQKGNLKIHLLTHTDLKKLFKCSECSYESNRKGDLNTHLLTHRKNFKLFKCSECTYECMQKGNLKKHIFRKHGMALEVNEQMKKVNKKNL